MGIPYILYEVLTWPNCLLFRYNNLINTPWMVLQKLNKWDKSGVNVRANEINQVFMSGFLSGQFLVFALQIARVERTQNKSETSSRHTGYMLHDTVVEKNRCNWRLHAMLAYYLYVLQMCQYSMQGWNQCILLWKMPWWQWKHFPHWWPFVQRITSHW